MFKIIDTHCHLDFPDYDNDREVLIKNTLEACVGMITIGTDLESSKKAVEIAEKYDGIFATIGVHPHEANKEFPKKKFYELIKNKKVVGVGECGLDFFRIEKDEEKTKKLQNDLFIKQIELAIAANKILVVHSRESYKETQEVLEAYADKLVGIVIHSFTGNYKEAKMFLDIGCYIGFNGIITYKPRKDRQPGGSDPELLAAVEKAPLEKILLETDAPFVSPVPFRGKRCEPFYVKNIAEKIAEVKKISVEDVVRITTENAMSFFKFVL